MFSKERMGLLSVCRFMDRSGIRCILSGWALRAAGVRPPSNPVLREGAASGINPAGLRIIMRGAGASVVPVEPEAIAGRCE